MAKLTPAEVAALNAAQRKPEPVMTVKTVTGPTGPKGDKGDTGPKGDPGAKGATGDTGKQGLQGSKGDIGPKGDKADKGDTGDAGKSGSKGPPGVGADGRVKVDSSDEPGFLADKLTAGSGVTIRKASSGSDERLVIDANPVTGGGGGGSAGLIVYDDGASVGVGNKVSFDGGDPVTIAGGIIHVPVGGGGGGSDDQTAAEVPFTPAGTISATNVQAAIEEVAAEAGGGGGGSGIDYVQDTDPGAVGAKKTWLDTTQNDTSDLGFFQLKVRNDTDDGWIRAGYSNGIGAQNIDAFSQDGSLDAYVDLSTDEQKANLGINDYANNRTFQAVATLTVAPNINPDGLQLKRNFTSDNPFLTVLDADPTTSGGVQSPVSSVGFLNDSGTGSLWLKDGSGATDWSQLGSGGGVTPATDPGDIADPLIADPTTATPEEVAIALNTFGVAYNTLLANLRTAGLLA